MKPWSSIFFAVLISGVTSCKTYYIPVSDFKQQFSGLTQSRTVHNKNPYGYVDTYKTYPIDSIKCKDKTGMWYLLANGPSIEVRFTEFNGQKTIFYFDRLIVDDTSVTGVRSRIISSITRTIRLDSVSLIEVQDGRKRYRYIQ